MKPLRALAVVAPYLAFASPAHAHVGGEVYAIPAVGLVLGALAGASTAGSTAPTRPRVVIAVAIATIVAAVLPMLIAQLPGTRGVRLALWWFFLASALVYLPYQFARLGVCALLKRRRASSAPTSGSRGDSNSGVP